LEIEILENLRLKIEDGGIDEKRER